jgi:hypothetical protein
MMSEYFIQGMIEEAKELYSECLWYEFGRKRYIQGWIKACEVILEIVENG